MAFFAFRIPNGSSHLWNVPTGRENKCCNGRSPQNGNIQRKYGWRNAGNRVRLLKFNGVVWGLPHKTTRTETPETKNKIAHYLYYERRSSHFAFQLWHLYYIVYSLKLLATLASSGVVFFRGQYLHFSISYISHFSYSKRKPRQNWRGVFVIYDWSFCYLLRVV